MKKLYLFLLLALILTCGIDGCNNISINNQNNQTNNYSLIIESNVIDYQQNNDSPQQNCQEIIPDRINLGCGSPGTSFQPLLCSLATSSWADGSNVETRGPTLDGKGLSHMGRFEGENINYFYAYLLYENTPISSDGTIEKTKKYTINLILDPRNYTKKEEYWNIIDARVVSFTC